MTKFPITKNGSIKITEEIRHLKQVERPAIIKAIASARELGDLSENAEYDAAKDAQGMMELKISQMEQKVATAKIIDESKLDGSKVQVLTTVKIKNKANGMEMSYMIVPEEEADLKAMKISLSSPIAAGLLGKKIGDVAEIKAPAGVMQFEVIEISL